MDQRIVKRLSRGFFANGFGQAVTVITQFMSVPLLISYWGKNLYGEWLILSAIPTYLSLSDFGFGVVAGNEMTMLISRANKKEALEVFQSTFLLTTVVVSVLIAIIVACIAYLPFDAWLHLSEIGHDGSILLLSLWIFIALIGLFDSLLEAGFRCDGNFAKGIFLSNLRRLAEFIALVSVVMLGADPVIGAATIAVVRVCGFLIMRFLLKRISPWIVYGFRHAGFLNVKRLAAPAITYVAYPLASAISVQGMVLIVGAVMGPASVVVFSVFRTLSRTVFQLIGLITNAVWPEFSLALGKGDMDLTRRLHSIATQLSFWASIVMTGLLFLIGEWLIRFWTHGKIEINYGLFGTMMAICLASSFWQASFVVLMSVNRHHKSTLVYLFGTIISTLSAILAMPKWGLEGAVLSLFIIDMLMGPYVILQALSLLESRFVPFFREIMRPPLSGFRILRQPISG